MTRVFRVLLQPLHLHLRILSPSSAPSPPSSSLWFLVHSLSSALTSPLAASPDPIPALSSPPHSSSASPACPSPPPHPSPPSSSAPPWPPLALLTMLTWPKLVEPLERIVDCLQVVWGIVSHLKSVKDSPNLRIAIEEVQGVRRRCRAPVKRVNVFVGRIIEEHNERRRIKDSRELWMP